MRRKLIASGLMFFVLILFAIAFLNPKKAPNISELNEAEKAYRETDGSYHYRSPLRVPLNPGLPRFLADKRDKALSSNSKANVLFLIVYKPETANDWNKADAIGSKFVDLVARQQAIDVGHTQWGWSCEIDGHRQEGASGYTGEQQDQALKFALQGWGATAALMTFNDGYFEPPWVVQVKSKSTKPENFKVLTVLVDSSSCEQLLSTYQDLRFKKLIKGFQLALDPKEKNPDLATGTNCTATAALLFSKVKGFPNQIFSNSLTNWKMPIGLFGFPQSPLPESVLLAKNWEALLLARKGTSVNILDTAKQMDTKEGTIEIQFFDPQKLLGAITQLPPVIDLQ